MSPYHSRQPRRNSSPTSPVPGSTSAPHHTRLQPPQFALHHPQEEAEFESEESQCVEEESGTSTSSSSPIPSSGSASPGNNVEQEAVGGQINNNNNSKSKSGAGATSRVRLVSQQQPNSQYYGTIPPRQTRQTGTINTNKINSVASNTGITGRPRGRVIAPAETNLFGHPVKKQQGGCGSGNNGTVLINPHMKQHNSFIKSEYVQLPGKDGCHPQQKKQQQSLYEVDEEEGWTKKERSGKKWKNCSVPVEDDRLDSSDPDGGLRRKLLLQKRFQQNNQQLQQNKTTSALSSGEPLGEPFKTKHSVTEEIPYYISTQ